MEDFVTFELAKKLEKKGFIQGFNIFGCRPIYSDKETIKFISDIGAYESDYFGENISCPTISQVLKWLREKKEVYVSVIPEYNEFNPVKGVTYRLEVAYWKDDEFGYETVEWLDKETYTIITFDSYEKALLEGIEYVIDNLI